MTTQYTDHITTPEMIQLARMTMGELMRDHELAQKALSQINLQDDPVREFIEDATAHGGLRRDDPEIAAHMLTSLVKALLHGPLMYTDAPMPFSKEKPELIECCVYMFLGYFG